MKLDKDVFTTFEAARICNANISSIKNWIDKGELEAFRTPGGHYRIEKKILDRFLKRYEMPNPFARAKRQRILVVQGEEELLEEAKKRFGDDYEYDWTDDAVDAVLKIGQWKPDLAVIDSRVEGLDVKGLCARVREHEDLNGVRLIALYGEGDGVGALGLKKAGAEVGLKNDQGREAVLAAMADLLAFA